MRRGHGKWEFFGEFSKRVRNGGGWFPINPCSRQEARAKVTDETLLNIPNPHHRLTKDLYPQYPFPLVAGKDWEKPEPKELTYHGHLILGAYKQETGLGFGRVFPAPDANYIKLLHMGFEVFANWRQPHRPFTSYLYAVTGGPDELMAVGKAIVEGNLRAVGAPSAATPSDVQAGERSRGVAHVEETRPKHFPHRIWAACDFEGRTPDYGWFGPPETGNIPHYPANTTVLGADDQPYQDFSALMTGINPVPGPRMGKVNQLYLRYLLRGGTEATFQHFSLTSEDNNHIRVSGLTEGRWSEVTLNFTRDGRRNDGAPGIPFQDGERMDDLKIFVGKPGDGKRYDLAIDDVIFFATDPDLAPEPEPFPDRVIFLAAFDTGATAKEKPKYWPGEFEIVGDDLPSGSYWNVARAVPQPDTKGKWIRLQIIPPRPVGARTKLRFRYHLTGTSQMTVQLFDLTDGDNRHIRLRDLEPGIWRTVYLDFARDARTGTRVWRSDKLPGLGWHSWWPVIYKDVVPFTRTEVEKGLVGFQNDWLFSGNRTANNLPGIRGTEPGDWVPGTPTVDIRTNPNGGTIPDWFERYPWRRSLIVLDRRTGKEVAFDLDNDGTTDAAPMLWAWTHGGTCYPPLVSGYDGVIYFRSVSHAVGQSIPGAATSPRAASPPADSDHDGMPDDWEKTHGLDPRNTGDGAAVGPNGYTNVENYLNALAGDTIPVKDLHQG